MQTLAWFGHTLYSKLLYYFKRFASKKKKFRCHANIATSAVNSVIVGNPIKKIHKVLTLEKYVETENVKRLQSMRWTKNISFDTTKKKLNKHIV